MPLNKQRLSLGWDVQPAATRQSDRPSLKRYRATLSASSYVLFVLLLAACAGNGPKYAENEGQNSADEFSHLYIYRPAGMFEAAVAPDIYVDGVKVLNIKNGSYTRIPLHKDEYLVELRGTWHKPTPTESISFAVNPPQDYYMKYAPRLSDFLFVNHLIKTTHLALIDSGVAVAEIQNCVYIEPENLISD